MIGTILIFFLGTFAFMISKAFKLLFMKTSPLANKEAITYCDNIKPGSGQGLRAIKKS